MKICFMLVPVSGMVILASVELSGELMQEIHQILKKFIQTISKVISMYT